MTKRIGRTTYEGLYVAITVPEDWKDGDPLPPANAEDQWFKSVVPFESAIGGTAWNHTPINRRPVKDEK
jgi:hypothetical protein